MIREWFRKRRLASLERELDLRLAVRREQARKRSQAALKGHSTQIKRRAAQCREMFK